ncbi:MAG: IMP dehydrogenase [Candidatus Hydrogenedens sp.]|nr:IMP dehydrogenase [Candidatus Hydrogenedens sp.]
MSIRVSLHHRTEYRYDRAIRLSPQIIRLRPAAHCRTRIVSYSLGIEPEHHFLNWQQDPFGNYLARIVVPDRTRSFSVEVGLTADLVVINPFDFFLDEDALEFPFSYHPETSTELKPYLEVGKPGPLIKEYLASIPRTPMHSLQFLVDLNQRLFKDVRYLIREEPGVQSPEETLTLRSGSCRDSAWLLVHLLRHFGLAARFVSGYLIQLTADEVPLDGPAGPVSDFTDLHAWTEVYLPGAGWVGLDPTSGLLAGEGHLPVACTPQPSSAAPISGSMEKCETEFGFEMSVERVRETPRISKPLTDEEWIAIDTLGSAIDADLQAHDVRLTMGGEPTFVSMYDRDSAQWHTDALGDDKWRMGVELFERLTERFSPTSLHHHGQGKWYPGESLPRWSLDCFFCNDGTPLWNDPELRGNEMRNYGYTPETAAAYMQTLCRHLGVEPAHSIAAHEDVFYYLWRERRLPDNVDPFDSRLDEPEERARLQRVFEQGLDHIAGYTLPLRVVYDNTGWFWQSGAWFLRAERMYLIPGDSPMGLRLPLDSLPWEVEDARHRVWTPDPSAWPPMGGGAGTAFEPLQRPGAARPGYARYLSQAPYSSSRSLGLNSPLHPWAGPVTYSNDASLVRTAICAEVRKGRLYVFMPPLQYFDHYLELLRAIEQTAAELEVTVIIEGYKPPHDPRVTSFSVRPDPGVIEVNIHPAADWSELKDFADILYEEARQTRLSSEKYGLDGRATGTGGGGHIVLGGPTTADSPFLRRPDLLKSMLGFWSNHPSLSYLFSGLFVGPTSQAPRVDEARNDMMPELQLAFDQINGGVTTLPWMVDRLFRHLLTDVTGNTHRAEFCIDKLYSPDSAEGRRGLLEMRAFEMAPHPRMYLLHQALIRAFIACFWKAPYDTPLVRWHTGLHDRFMLPYFIQTDFEDVLNHLRRHGYDFRPEWFRTLFEFRFPKFGEIVHDGVKLEIRAAIEPWPVLGEQVGGGGTTRYVDSSLDRVQVLVRGLVDPRHKIACNGFELPLHSTGTIGEFVAGVRYRAWPLSESLHPCLPENVPLIFDIVDTWNDRALGGCTLWSAHPGGRSYESYPINANEAEARRQVRFSPMGHSRGSTHMRPAPKLPEFPMTLDLRHEYLHV